MKRFAKKVLAGMIALSIAFSGVTFTQKDASKVNAAVGDWNLVWSDEFEGTSLNRNNWNVEVNGSGGGNNELQYYLDNTNNIQVSNGTLKLIARKERYGNKSYTSGRINTKGKQEFKYGRIEARLKLPRFNGIWPAFWTLGANYDTVGWPSCGEMDIMEAINNNDEVFSNLHWSYNGNQADTKGPIHIVNDRTQWHIYGMEWDEDTVKFYCDDTVYFIQGISSDAQMEEFRKKQFIILNLAVGGQLPGYTIDDSAMPATMEVDWVRVYQKEEAPTTEYEGPWITVTQDAVAECASGWVSWFGDGWTGAKGTLTSGAKPSDGFIINASSIGAAAWDSVWGIQGQLLRLKYYPGNTYTYKCTITLSVDKKIYVKIVGEGESNLAGGYIDVKANEPYQYETTVYIEDDYEGELSLKFGMGKTDGDTVKDNSAAVFQVTNLSFTTTATIPDPNYVSPTTKQPDIPSTTNKPDVKPETSLNTESVTGENNTGNIEQTSKTDTPKTTGKLSEKSPDVPDQIGTTKVKKTVKSVTSKKIKITLKKIQGAKKYQVQISKTKKFKKPLVKKTVKKVKVAIKNKKLANRKKLYVRVRAVVVSGGTKYYGNWSKIKKVKIKK